MTRDQMQMQRRYDELLALPNLWPAEVALLRWLAAQLGRRVEFVKVALMAGDVRRMQ